MRACVCAHLASLTGAAGHNWGSVVARDSHRRKCAGGVWARVALVIPRWAHLGPPGLNVVCLFARGTFVANSRTRVWHKMLYATGLHAGPA